MTPNQTPELVDLPKSEHILWRFAGTNTHKCKKCGKQIYGSCTAPGLLRGVYCHDCYADWKQPPADEYGKEVLRQYENPELKATLDTGKEENGSNG